MVWASCPAIQLITDGAGRRWEIGGTMKGKIPGKQRMNNHKNAKGDAGKNEEQHKGQICGKI